MNPHEETTQVSALKRIIDIIDESNIDIQKIEPLLSDYITKSQHLDLVKNEVLKRSNEIFEYVEKEGFNIHEIKFLGNPIQIYLKITYKSVAI